ncbi:butyrophilin subfamily 1 member A1 isoform X2 [Lates calcarifer]|uniref:Butyrophilin subfamily 1 member A1 isoform X2 n=1 Tax=Lates calcarifer TaxID=8187 RepID=A0AAJ7Q0L6_LATCA|nr:butyrophilin subfamily 1 member A1 isoform X2 [Lates calcarifer]
MGLQMMYLLTLLSTSLFSASVTGSPVVVVGPPVTVHQGHTAILPCWLNPPQNAEDLEVQWYRSDRFDSPIVLSSKKFDASKEASYIGRVSFGLKDASSGGLTGGDVSLKLVNVTIEDAGDYTCYVSSEQGYDRENVKLHVIEMGTHPLLSAVWREDNSVHVSCESQGWYPEPKLRWSDQKQDLTPKVLKYNNVSSGLVSVRSWLLVPTSSEVSCSVGLPDGEAKESRMRLEKPAKQDSGFSAGWVAFAILLIAALSSLGLLFYKRRDLLCAKDKLERNQAEENEKLLKQVKPTAFEEARSYYVNITLETGKSIPQNQRH